MGIKSISFLRREIKGKEYEKEKLKEITKEIMIQKEINWQDDENIMSFEIEKYIYKIKYEEKGTKVIVKDITTERKYEIPKVLPLRNING